MSQRWACTVLLCYRIATLRQGSRVDDVKLGDRMKAIAHERRRFGYRRLHVLLRREGYVVNHKRLFRMYREENSRFGAGGAGNGPWERERRWPSQ